MRFLIGLIAWFGLMRIATAQNFYVNAAAGYNFESGRDVLSITTKTSGDENVYGSFGKGFCWSAGIGCMLGENVGGEVNFSMLTGAEYKATYSDASGNEGKRTLKGSMMRLIPAVKLSAGKQLQPYCKFGLVIGLNPKVEGTSSIKYPGGATTLDDKLYGGNPIGFMGALGLENKLSSALFVYAEINFIGQRWAAEKDDWTLMNNNGGVITKESGTTSFKDKVDSHVPESDIFNVPLEELKVFKPFSSFGFCAGIRFAFGPKKASG